MTAPARASRRWRSIGSDGVYAWPPPTSSASCVTRGPVSVHATFASMSATSASSSPASPSRAASASSVRADRVWRSISASWCWIVGSSASAVPSGYRREAACPTAVVVAAWAIPTFTAARPARNVGATTPKTRSPAVPASPMRSSSVTATLSNVTATLALPAMPRPCHSPSKVTPRASFSTA